MIASKRVRHLLMAAAVVLLAATGCGGDDKSCADGCAAIFACANKFGVNPSSYGATFSTQSECVNQCNTCPGKQGAINCVLGVSCPASNISTYVYGITSCIDQNCP